MDIMPNDRELKALRLFQSADTTRHNLATVWEYTSEGGCTHVAADGHVLAMRRAGTHASMLMADIEKLPPKALMESNAKPPRWSSVVKAPNCEGPNLAKRGINPAYFALVAAVETAATKRAAEDYEPKPGASKKTTAKVRRELACYSEWQIGCDPLDGWRWSIPGDSITWEGVIMPRRV